MRATAFFCLRKKYCHHGDMTVVPEYDTGWLGVPRTR
jgi:hypothetical protein